MSQVHNAVDLLYEIAVVETRRIMSEHPYDFAEVTEFERWEKARRGLEAGWPEYCRRLQAQFEKERAA